MCGRVSRKTVVAARAANWPLRTSRISSLSPPLDPRCPQLSTSKSRTRRHARELAPDFRFSTISAGLRHIDLAILSSLSRLVLNTSNCGCKSSCNKARPQSPSSPAPPRLRARRSSFTSPTLDSEAIYDYFERAHRHYLLCTAQYVSTEEGSRARA